MSNASAAELNEELDDGDMGVSSASLAKFQLTIAKYGFTSESPNFSRSTRESKARKLNDPPSHGGEESEEQVNMRQTPQSRNNKRKGDEHKLARKKPKRGCAEPERYAHLDGLSDILGNELDVLFCGINPGEYSATVGHHFANPRNHFWRCLFESGLTGKYIRPSEDHTIPGLKPFSLGLTNLVDRPTAEQSELSSTELVTGVSVLLEKIIKCRPRMVCFVGLGIATTVKNYCFPVIPWHVFSSDPALNLKLEGDTW
ncbi:hypothetical protein AX15_005844 [Amanita polypyramis BW_CC]|nr:hypothetical protein AX15_005844 [Amanita polypyramis BW_CC]